jgi:hypothetical protein
MSDGLTEWVILFQVQIGGRWLPECVTVRALDTKTALQLGHIEADRLMAAWQCWTGGPFEIDEQSFSAELAEDFWTQARQEGLRSHG